MSTTTPPPRYLIVLPGIWIVALVLALYPYTSDPATPIKQLLTAAIAVLTVLAVGWASFRGDVTWRWKLPGFALLLSWLGVFAIAAICSHYPAYSLNAMRGWFGFALMGFLVAQICRNPETFWRIAVWIVAAVAFSSVYGHAQGFGWDPFPWAIKNSEEYRGLPSTYANPNFAGHTLLLAILLALGLLAQGQRWTRALAGVALLLMTAHIYRTGMRGAWLGLGAAVVLMTVYAYRARQARDPERAATTTFLTLALGAAVAATLLLGVLLFARGENAPHPGSSSVLRLNGYQGAARMALDRPLLGFGPGVYTLENAPYWTDFEKRWFAVEGRKNDHVHCEALESAVDAGFPGAFLFFAVLSYAIWTALRLAGRSPAHHRAGLTLAAAFVAFAVDGLVGFNLRVPVSSGLFFVLFGALEGMSAPSLGSPRGRIFAPTLLLIFSLCLAGVEALAFRAETLFQRGVGALQWAHGHPGATANQLDHAYLTGRQCFESGILSSPWDGRFPTQLVRLAREKGLLEEAEQHLKNALQREPNHPGLWVELAMLRVNRASQTPDAASSEALLTGAEEAALRAQTLCDQLPLPEEVLGRVALMRATARESVGKPDPALWADAATHAKAALTLGPPDRKKVLRIAVQAYLKTGELDKAQDAFEFLAKLTPGDEVLWREFRTFCEQNGREQVLRDALGRSLRQVTEARGALDKTACGTLVRYLDVLSVRAGEDLAWPQRFTRTWLGRVPKDEKLWGAYLQLFPEAQRDAMLDAACGEIGLSLCPERIQMLAPTAQTPLDALASRLSRDAAATLPARGQEEVTDTFLWMADRLIARLEAAPSLDTAAQGIALRGAGQIAFCAGNWAQAESTLRRALPLLSPKDAPSGWVGLSMALAEMHKAPEALEAAQEADKLDPEGFSTRWNLARRLVDAGRNAEAQFQYATLLDRNVPPATRALLEQEAGKLAAESPGGSPTP